MEDKKINNVVKRFAKESWKRSNFFMFEHSWLEKICFKNGKPDYIAIMILSDIYFWYQPIIKRNSKTGKIISIEQKFKYHMVQKDKSDYAKLLKATPQQIKRALKNLETKGFIRREYKPIKREDGSLIRANKMFIEINFDKVKELCISEINSVI